MRRKLLATSLVIGATNLAIKETLNKLRQEAIFGQFQTPNN